MKKTLSVILAALMLVLCLVPAGAESSTHSVTFVGPSATVGTDAYFFVKYNGDTAANKFDYVEDENGGYVYYEEDGQYYYYDDILFDDDKALFEGAPRYSPVCYPVNEAFTVEDGEQLVFVVMTNEVYDATSVVVNVNGSVLEHRNSDYGEYSVTVDRDLVINVTEFTDGGATEVLLRNHYTLTLVSGDGYTVKTLATENNKYVYYGDTFKFRVKITKGYSANDMTVKVVPSTNGLTEFLGEDADLLTNLMDKSEPLTCLGTDADGCYLFESGPITSDCRVIVSNVREESKSTVLAKLKRILKLILDALGIHLDILDDFVTYYNVTVDASAAIAHDVDYELTASATDDAQATNFTVLSGEGVKIKVTKKSEAQNVSVSWKIGDKNFSAENYQTQWTSKFNRYTGEYTWSAEYLISAIDADTVITITAD